MHPIFFKLTENWLWRFLRRNASLSFRTPKATSYKQEHQLQHNKCHQFLRQPGDGDEAIPVKPRWNLQCRWDRPDNCPETTKSDSYQGSKTSGPSNKCWEGYFGYTIQCHQWCGEFNFPRPWFSLMFISRSTWSWVNHLAPRVLPTLVDGWLQIFSLNHTRCTQEKPVLFIMDNHESHISLKANDRAKASGIALLTFPTHCSHKMHPLDHKVYRLLKRFYNASCDSWLMNPRKAHVNLWDCSKSWSSLEQSLQLSEHCVFSRLLVSTHSTGIFLEKQISLVFLSLTGQRNQLPWCRAKQFWIPVAWGGIIDSKCRIAGRRSGTWSRQWGAKWLSPIHFW